MKNIVSDCKYTAEREKRTVAVEVAVAVGGGKRNVEGGGWFK